MARGKYKRVVDRRRAKKIQSWFRDGLSDIQVAKNMGISKTTFYDWINKYPAIPDAVKRENNPLTLKSKTPF